MLVFHRTPRGSPGGGIELARSPARAPLAARTPREGDLWGGMGARNGATFGKMGSNDFFDSPLDLKGF